MAAAFAFTLIFILHSAHTFTPWLGLALQALLLPASAPAASLALKPHAQPQLACRAHVCAHKHCLLATHVPDATMRLACNATVCIQPNLLHITRACSQLLLAGTLTASLLDSESLHGGSPISARSNRPITPLSDLSLYSAAASLRAGAFSPHMPPPPWYTKDIIAGGLCGGVVIESGLSRLVFIMCRCCFLYDVMKQ